jgi:hypothetical protein
LSKQEDNFFLIHHLSSMVEINSPSSSFGAYISPRSSPTSDRSSRKPLWLYCVYVLFGLVCLNAVRTYHRQKEFVRFTLSSNDNDFLDDNINQDGTISYSAGAEEHVVSGNYGSSMYGGGIHTARSKPKTEPTRGARIVKLENNVNPKPSDGSADFNARKPKAAETSDFEAFSFYVLTDTPVSFRKEINSKMIPQVCPLRLNFHLTCFSRIHSFPLAVQ